MENKQKDYISTAVLVSVFYVAVQMMSDIASLRIVMIAGFSIDAGTFIYPLTFTLRDMVHKVAGIKTARMLILAAAGIKNFRTMLSQAQERTPMKENISQDDVGALGAFLCSKDAKHITGGTHYVDSGANIMGM